MRPSVGRIVHFRAYPDAECEAAMVAAVRPASPDHGLDETLGLVVFRASHGEAVGFEMRNDVRQAEPGWHWPERVE